MSKITDIVIITSLDENEAPVEFLNDYFEDHASGLGRPLKEIGHEHAGGGKNFCGRLYAASINYLNVENFIEYARTAPWVSPATVQLLMQREEDVGFRRVDLSSDDLIERLVNAATDAMGGGYVDGLDRRPYLREGFRSVLAHGMGRVQ